jgi:hypothetical protein
MANTYSWVISQLEAYPTHQAKTNVVFSVHWRRQVTNGKYNADIYGSQAITFNPDDTFTQYENLTQEEIEGWLESEMGADKVSELDAMLDKQIEIQINPTVVSPPLPWGNII